MAVNIARVLVANGHSNALIVSREGGIQTDRLPNGIGLTFLGKKNFYHFSAFFRLVKAIKTFKPDVIHAHSTSIFWAFLASFFYPKAILIWHDHYGLMDQLKPGDRKLERMLSRWLDGVIVVNQQLKNWILQETAIKEESVVMIPNFPFLQSSFDQDRFLTSPVILLQLANFRRQKNHLLSLQAVDWLNSNSATKVELWLAGVTSLDPAYTLEIRQEIDKLKLDAQVKLLGETENIENLLQKAHIGLLSSDSEGLPVSLLEYGLAGLPVVVTQVGDCAEVLENGNYGQIVGPGDSVGFGKSVKSLIDNYSEAVILGKSFKVHIERAYGGQGFLSTYMSFLGSLK